MSSDLNEVAKDVALKTVKTKLHNLSHTYRYSGFKVLVQESVSDHICSMMAMAHEIVFSLNEYLMSIYGDKFTPVDIKDVVYRISIHDYDEALCLDIPRNFKYSSKELKDAIEKATDNLMSKEFTPELMKQVKNAKSVGTIEGLIVKILDSAQAGCYMISEIMLGNQYIRSELNNVVDVLEDCRIHYCTGDKKREFLAEYIKEMIKIFQSYLKN